MKKIILGVLMFAIATPVAADFSKKKVVAEVETAAEQVETKAPVFMPPAPGKPAAVAAVKKSSTAASVAVPAAAPAANMTEAQSKLQAIEKQEQWVSKLTKQLEGEKNQLKEMRESYTQAFGKEPK